MGRLGLDGALEKACRELGRLIGRWGGLLFGQVLSFKLFVFDLLFAALFVLLS